MRKDGLRRLQSLQSVCSGAAGGDCEASGMEIECAGCREEIEVQGMQVCGSEDYGGEAAGWAAGVPEVFAAV